MAAITKTKKKLSKILII